ncbi:hypothetical protein PHMEG_0002986, partial [Phytophthora megakarya]
TVPSLFTTGSGKTVSVSASRLRAYEEKLRSEEESVVGSVGGPGAATTSTAGTGNAATVPSLFTTGSGKTVSVSASRLRAYEEKLRSEEESVVGSVGGPGAATTSTAGTGNASTVPSLFTTGSGKTVSVSASRLRAYEEKLRSEEESVVGNVATGDGGMMITATSGGIDTSAEPD